MEKREWQPREMKMVQEYMREHHAKARRLTRVRLGNTILEREMRGLTAEEARMLVVWRRWADAVAIYPDHVVLVEGSIRPDPGDPSKLELYRELLPQTPELAEQIRGKPVMLELVTSIHDPAVERMCRERGIKYVLFTPPWIPDYLKLLYPRERRAPLE